MAKYTTAHRAIIRDCHDAANGDAPDGNDLREQRLSDLPIENAFAAICSLPVFVD